MEKVKMALVFSHCPDPRVNKRIALFKNTFDVSNIYWNRNPKLKYEVVHNDVNNIEINSSGSYGKILTRAVSALRFGIRAVKELKKIKPDIIYVGNIDMLFFVNKYYKAIINRPIILYEIADLHTLIIDKQKYIFKRILRSILINLEKRLCNDLDILVLTSEKFFDVYYKEFIPPEKMFYLPNMPDLVPFNNYKHQERDKFTIGFIGTVRYKDQMKLLIDAAEKIDINVLFAGAGFDNEIEEICRTNPNIRYYGKYDYNTEISFLYSEIDCVYSVYDASMVNVRIALPNKLYEAIYCELPIIVSKGTYLADIVEQLGVGIAVSHTDITELIEVLDKLKNNKGYYYSFVESCKKHKSKIDITKYNEQLLSKLKSLVNRRLH